MKKMVTALSILLTLVMLISQAVYAVDQDMEEDWMGNHTVLELTGSEPGKKVSQLSVGTADRNISNFEEYLDAISNVSVSVSASLDGKTESSMYYSENPYQNQQGESEYIAVLKADQEHPWKEESSIVIRVEDLVGAMSGLELEMGASEDGPRDYKISYSIDQKKTWNDFNTLGTDLGTISVPNSTGTVFKKSIVNISIPYENISLHDKIENKRTGEIIDYDWDMMLYDDIYFKISPVSDYKVNGESGLYGSAAGEWGIRSVNILQAMLKPADLPSDYVEVPEAPQPVSVKAYKTGQKAITLTWKKPASSCNYEIYLKKGNGTYQKIKTVKASKKAKFVIKNLSPTATYKLRINAYDKGLGGSRRNSGYTKPITINMKKQPLPENLSVKKSVSVKTGKKKNLAVKCTGGTSKNYIKGVSYKVKNPKIASAKSSGTIQGKKKGDTKVTVKVTLKSGLKKTFVTKVKVN